MTEQMAWKCRFGFHDWTKWGDTEMVKSVGRGPNPLISGDEGVIYPKGMFTVELYQTRNCHRCGQRQRRKFA